MVKAAGVVCLALAIAGTAGIGAARAESPLGWEHREKEVREIHDRTWQEHERRAERWHRHHFIPAPNVVYAPPAVVVAPPPPPMPSGINLIIPLNIL